MSGNDVALDSARLSFDNGAVRETRVYHMRPAKGDGGERLSGRLLGVAGLLVFGTLLASGYVGYEAQRLFALAHNHVGDAITADDRVRAVIVAALPDVGWVAMALVALVAALRGQSSLRARIGVVVFFAASLAAQVLYARPTVEGILIAVIAPVTMAWMLETFIVEVRRWAAKKHGLDIDETPILSSVLRWVVRLLFVPLGIPLWFLRLFLDRKGTWSGFREWLLDTAPVAPGRTRASIAAARAVEQAREAEVTVEQVRAETSEQVRELQEKTAAQLQQERAAIEAERQALNERVRREAEMAREQIETRYAPMVTTLQSNLSTLQEELRQERAARAQAEELAAARNGKERLIALYEQLSNKQDARYGDRSKASELARELYQQAGLQSEGTARQYLYDHLDSRNTPELVVNGWHDRDGSE